MNCKWKEGNLWKYATIVAFVVANIMFFVLALGKTFHYDESYSLGMISNHFGDIINITSQDVHSPFYYFALKIFCMIPGINVFFASKLFSWIFISAYVIFGGRMIKKIYGWQVTFFWVLLSCFMPSMLIQATTVRMYTMGLFFMTLSSYLAYSIFRHESRKKWIAFTVASVITVYVHTFCMLEMVIVYGLFIIVALVKKKYRLVWKAFLSGGIVSICFMPWLFSLWKQFSRWAGWENGWTSSFEPITLQSFPIFFSEWFSSMEKPNALAVVFVVTLFIYVGYYVRKYVEERKDYLPCLGLVLVGCILVLATVVSNYIVPCFLGRYALPLFAGVWLFLALGISLVPSVAKKTIITACIIILGAVAFREEVRLENADGLKGYQTYIEENVDFSTDVFMADRYFTMLLSVYYPEADYMVYGGAPAGLPFINTEGFTEWEQLDGVDTVWMLCFADNQGANLNGKFQAVESFRFDYSYYKMKVEKWCRLQTEE